MFNNVSNVEEFKRYLDEMVKLNFRSRYMTNLYEAKKEKKRYLTEEEEKDYLLHCSILYSTSLLFFEIYRNFISTAYIGDNQIYQQRAEEHAKGVVWNPYSFGAIDSNKIKNNITNLQYNGMNVYEENKKVVIQELMGSTYTEMAKKVSEIAKNLTPEEKRSFLDKAMLTFDHGGFSNGVVWDKEAAKDSARKYNLGDPNQFVANVVDYSELLAMHGINMGELPKTYVSEIIGEQSYGRSTGRR